MYSEGNYWCRVVAQSLGRSSTKKTPQFVLTFAVLGRMDPADPSAPLLGCDPGERSMYMSFASEKATEITVGQLQALGFVRNSFRMLDPSVEGYHDFAGTEFAAYCRHGEYQGRMKEEWSVSRPRSEPQPLEAEDARKLDALYGRFLANGHKTVPGKSLASPATDIKAETVAAGEDDVPF